jgi:MOSC domain-containing protein YiiM
VGDPQRHLTRAKLEARWMALSSPNSETGEVLSIVIRQPDGTRVQPSIGRLDPEQGLIGDRWTEGKADPSMQVAVMRADVAHIIANGQSPALFGDNLLVDMDLSRGNLPPGTVVSVGTARCVVSAEPHNGCSLFSQRFGHAALALTADKRWRDQNLRGLYLTIMEAGDVGPGDRMVILEPPYIAIP